MRESIFLNGILTNAEVWYGLKKSELKELEGLDKMLIRKILDTPFSTPTEAIQLELGLISIPTLIKARRINYLHYLATRSESEMLFKFFKAQWTYSGKDDWTRQVKLDLRDLQISEDLEFIKSKSKQVFNKVLDFEFKRLSQLKITHSKMSNLS